MSDQEDARSWLEKLSDALSGEPGSREELLDILRSSEQRSLLDRDALSIIEGAITVSDKQVREIMIPRAQVVIVRMTQTPEDILHTVIGCGHSRFPVLAGHQEEVVGILLAKDLLPLALKDRPGKFSLRDILRPVTGVPESKRVDVLLQEFRTTRNHLAVVFDEYGAISGIVTIEDVLEQIVGDIEDEFDFKEEAFIHQQADGSFTIRALTPISEFNKRFGAEFEDEEFDTIGGLVTNRFGRLPKRDERIDLEGFCFKVLNADVRKVFLLQMTMAE